MLFVFCYNSENYPCCLVTAINNRIQSLEAIWKALVDISPTWVSNVMSVVELDLMFCYLTMRRVIGCVPVDVLEPEDWEAMTE